MLELPLCSGPGPDEADVSRRTFLKLAGFAFTGAMVSGCQRAPVRNAVAPLTASDTVVPGRALNYASTCGGCNAGCGVWVKTRDGRPIKLEGNPTHPLSMGGLCAAGQASILGLYDRQRLQHALKSGAQATWGGVDAEIRTQLDELRRQGRAVRFLSGTITSPTTRKAIADFLADFPNARHVVWDPVSSAAIGEAHFRTHGVRAWPQYRLDQADVLVSFDADFLGTWRAPVPFAAAYKVNRYLQGAVPSLSYHVQFESRMSLTGAKADQRLCVAPGELGVVMTQLAKRLAARAGLTWGGADPEASSVPPAFLDDLAARLWASGQRHRSLVLCGSQEIAHQLLCNFINHLLGSYGATLDLQYPSHQSQGNDQDVHNLLDEIKRGDVGALLVYRSNPAYDLPLDSAAVEKLRAIPLLISFGQRLDETAALARYVCPEPHCLESWNDAEAVDGVLSLYQPTIERLGDTRSLLESLAAWKSRPRSAYDQLRDYWQTQIYPGSRITTTWQEFWNKALQDGWVWIRPRGVAVGEFNAAAVAPVRPPARPFEGGHTLVLHAKVGMPDGSHAYNPWLQELPDPLSKMTWDNYACLSPAAATQLDLRNGDEVRLEGFDGPTLTLPVVIQPGQHDKVVAVAVGYGSKLSERFADIGPPWMDARPSVGDSGLVGVNAAPLLSFRDGAFQYRRAVRLVKTGRRHALACTQEQPSIRQPATPVGTPAPPPIIRETTLPVLLETPQSATPAPARENLWPNDHPVSGPRWGMVIDLTSCTGCSACVIGCQVENNIPVVGRDEVRRHREMHWLRIDRYYSTPSSLPSPVDGGPRRDTEVDVAHQPMLCQQCGNAPCETVCPVLATVHSSEGLNQQVYNRCVGTRYCANNCPYKVRRFNWFDYAHEDQLQNLVLNPDVTVRSRGVMEKCTFCIQRIQEAKIEARRLGQPLADGDIQTACQQSCPTKAILFGDLNDPQSRAAQQAAKRRAYRVLEELGVQPAVSYLDVVRNRPTLRGRG
jgi:molybdopterin-containing oxidoreductase family iron-sulfur binding subunit